jgi:prepilin-type N-terminal cleavage/methylation domain-containing protein
MNIHTKGFSLIEVMIGLVITVTLITTIIPWSIQTIAYYHASYIRINRSMEFCFARNLLLTDICNGSLNATAWKSGDTTRLIGKRSDGTWFCWMVRNGNLVRIASSSGSIIQKPEPLRAIPALRGVDNFAVHVSSKNGQSRLITIDFDYHGQYTIKGAPRYEYI